LVETAIAVRASDPLVAIKDAATLRDALLAADAIFVPDTKASTAGIHVAKVLRQLGIADAVTARLKIYPNGATAMRHLAASDALRPIGCTQSTEIISTKGVVLSGSLPPGCELATMYTAAVTTRASNAKQAQVLIDLLTDANPRELRERAGFLSAKR
jgi:molybdate transport system substrate-binding protein